MGNIEQARLSDIAENRRAVAARTDP